MISKILVSGICTVLLAGVAMRSIAEENTQAGTNSDSAKPCVILLHGLARTSASMNDMQSALIDSGYLVAKIDYPSREKKVQELATPAINKGLSSCALQGASPVHVVTHSMGGILFRQYVLEHGADKFARTVMLAPPNHGSEAVDSLKEIPGFQWLNGPAGLQLGTDKNSLPLALGPATSDVAVIAGTFSINIVLSTYLPDPDDGKVSVASTRLEGMCAHLQQDVSHPYIMKDERVIKEVISYLDTGKFTDPASEYLECSHKYFAK